MVVVILFSGLQGISRMVLTLIFAESRLFPELPLNMFEAKFLSNFFQRTYIYFMFPFFGVIVSCDFLKNFTVKINFDLKSRKARKLMLFVSTFSDNCKL